jgi:hypothetical protein
VGRGGVCGGGGLQEGRGWNSKETGMDWIGLNWTTGGVLNGKSHPSEDETKDLILLAVFSLFGPVLVPLLAHVVLFPLMLFLCFCVFVCFLSLRRVSIPAGTFSATWPDTTRTTW